MDMGLAASSTASRGVSELLRIGELDPDLLIERIRVVERVDGATLDKAVEWVDQQRIDLERDAHA